MGRGRFRVCFVPRCIGLKSAFLIISFSILSPGHLSAQNADDGSWWSWQWSTAEQRPNSLALSGGYGTEQYFSRLITSPWNTRDSGDRLVALSAARELGRIGRRALGFEIQGMYGFHFGRLDYNEFSLAFVSRWHDFPWNDWVVTTFAFGLGPSYTNKIPPIEADKGITSKVLNQADIEFTFALPSSPWNELFFRLEHRSGVFGLIDGAGDGSNFLTLGYRYHF